MLHSNSVVCKGKQSPSSKAPVLPVSVYIHTKAKAKHIVEQSKQLAGKSGDNAYNQLPSHLKTNNFFQSEGQKKAESALAGEQQRYQKTVKMRHPMAADSSSKGTPALAS